MVNASRLCAKEENLTNKKLLFRASLLVVMVVATTLLSFVRMVRHPDISLLLQSLALIWIAGAVIARTIADGQG